MTTYEHQCNACNKEFEQEYGMTEPVPTLCPLCGIDGQVKRLISGGSGRGIVSLTGHELKSKLREEGRQLKRSALSNEKVLRDLVGDDKIQQTTVSMEKEISNLPKPPAAKKTD